MKSNWCMGLHEIRRPWAHKCYDRNHLILAKDVRVFKVLLTIAVLDSRLDPVIQDGFENSKQHRLIGYFMQVLDDLLCGSVGSLIYSTSVFTVAEFLCYLCCCMHERNPEDSWLFSLFFQTMIDCIPVSTMSNFEDNPTFVCFFIFHWEQCCSSRHSSLQQVQVPSPFFPPFGLLHRAFCFSHQSMLV